MSESLEKLAIVIGKKLKQNNLRLATVESCTGGGLSYWITSVPGSSSWFERGFVTYTKEAKMDLGVNAATIEQYGEVSEATAKEMAENGLKKSLANICIAITGIAGPDGGSEQKPVGTVWIACAKQNTETNLSLDEIEKHFIQATVFLFSGNREAVREQSIEAAMEMIVARMIISSGDK